MPPEATAFPRLQKIKVTLDKHNNLIFEAERERTNLEIELSDLKGLARLTKKKELESRIATKNEEIRTLKAGLSVSSDNMDLQQCMISTQPSIPPNVPQTHIKINVPSAKKPTEKNPLQKPKPCTKSYSGIKKRLTDTMPANLIEAEIKGRDNRSTKRIASSDR